MNIDSNLVRASAPRCGLSSSRRILVTARSISATPVVPDGFDPGEDSGLVACTLATSPRSGMPALRPERVVSGAFTPGGQTSEGALADPAWRLNL